MTASLLFANIRAYQLFSIVAIRNQVAVWIGQPDWTGIIGPKELLMSQNHIAGKQPNSRHCFVCGLENPVGLQLKIYLTGPGVIETVYTAPEHFQGYPGVLHGGIVAAILDEISGRSHMGADPSASRFMFTAKLEVKYRQNVPTGKPLKIIGKP